MDRLQKIELLKGIQEGRRNIVEIAQQHQWIVVQRSNGRFTNPDTGKTFLPSEFDAELRQAQLRHAAKRLSVLRITSRGTGMDEQITIERFE